MRILVNIPDEYAAVNSNIQDDIDDFLTDYCRGTVCDVKVLDEMTFGNVIQAVFPNVQSKIVGYTEYIGNEEFHGKEVVLDDRVCFDKKRWDSPYRKEQE